MRRSAPIHADLEVSQVMDGVCKGKSQAKMDDAWGYRVFWNCCFFAKGSKHGIGLVCCGLAPKALDYMYDMMKYLHQRWLR